MKIKKILFSLLALLLLVRAPAWVFAEFSGAPEKPEAFEGNRSIYVGDIITLSITASDFSEEELRQIFKDFEIIEIKVENGSYLLSLRTFEIGKYTVLLGDKEIIIDVQSTLNDIRREDIFEGDAWVMTPGFPFYWRVLFYAAAGAFVLSGGFVLCRAFKKRNVKKQSPLQLFLRRSGALSAEDNNYFVDLTFYFKEYIENLYKCRIIGKTSGEIVNELKEIQALSTLLPEIQEWLMECDRLKFTGVEVPIEEKQARYKELHNLVEKIDLQNEGVA